MPLHEKLNSSKSKSKSKSNQGPFRVFATRESRKRQANTFIRCIRSESDPDYVIQACTSASVKPCLTQQESKNGFGITYLALQGIDSTCVVVRNDDLQYLVNKKCPLNDKEAADHFLQMFWNLITTEVEDIEDSIFQGNNPRPFAVVTAALSKGGCESSQASTAKHWAKNTCKSLWDEMKKGYVFTSEKTEQTAISAGHHFFSGFPTEYENTSLQDSGGRLRVYVRENKLGFGKELLQNREIYDREELMDALTHYPPYEKLGSGNLYPLNEEDLGSGVLQNREIDDQNERLGSGMFYPLNNKNLEGDIYSRRGNAIALQNCRKAGGCTSGETICISPNGCIVNLDENLYGFTHVVVHGEGSIWAVARTVDWADVKFQAEQVSCIGIKGNALVYEAEDLTLPCGDRCKMTSRQIKKPFVALSVAPITDSGHEALDLSVIQFLQEEMDWGTTNTLQGSLKTAIFTLNKLFCKTFEADEIEIFGLSTHSKLSQVIEYPIRGRRSIEDYLKDVNKPCSGGSSSGKRSLDISNKACKRMRVQ